MATFVLKVEIKSNEYFQHPFHLGTDLETAKSIAEEIWDEYEKDGITAMFLIAVHETVNDAVRMGARERHIFSGLPDRNIQKQDQVAAYAAHRWFDRPQIHLFSE